MNDNETEILTKIICARNQFLRQEPHNYDTPLYVLVSPEDYYKIRNYSFIAMLYFSGCDEIKICGMSVYKSEDMEPGTFKLLKDAL